MIESLYIIERSSGIPLFLMELAEREKTYQPASNLFSGFLKGIDDLVLETRSENIEEIRMGSTRIVFVKNAFVTTHIPSSLKYFTLTEFRWMTALIRISGVDYVSLGRNSSVVAALVFLLPWSKTLWIASLVFHIMYILKRVRMFTIASRRYKTDKRNIIGFVILSYGCHVIDFLCYIKHFLGLSEETYLHQGQRY